jgi:hypothetical protein
MEELAQAVAISELKDLNSLPGGIIRQLNVYFRTEYFLSGSCIGKRRTRKSILIQIRS